MHYIIPRELIARVTRSHKYIYKVKKIAVMNRHLLLINDHENKTAFRRVLFLLTHVCNNNHILIHTKKYMANIRIRNSSHQ